MTLYARGVCGRFVVLAAQPRTSADAAAESSHVPRTRRATGWYTLDMPRTAGTVTYVECVVVGD